MMSNRWLRTLAVALVLIGSVAYSQVLLFGAKEKGKKYGYINERGDYVIAPAFDAAGIFSKGYAVVKVGKKYGIINEQGQFTVQPQYDGVQPYAPEAKFTVKKGDKWGVVSASGEIIIPFQHEYLSILKDGYVVAGKTIPGKAYKNLLCPTVLNEQNQIVYRPGDEDLDPDSHDCTQLFLPGYYNTKGFYSNGWPAVSNNYLVVKESWEGGPDYAVLKLIDVRTGIGPALPTGTEMSDFYFGLREGTIAIDRAASQEWGDDTESQEADEFGSGIIRTENGQKRWGEFYDTALLRATYFEMPLFSESIEKQKIFQQVHPYFNNVAAVEKDNRWIFIDRDGWVINETNLSTAEYKAYPPMYFNGLIGMFKNGKAGYVDINGKEVIPFELQEYHPFEYSVTPVKKNGLYGLLRKDGSWAVPPRFVDLFITPCPCFQ